MGWGAIPSVIDKLLGRFLPKKEEALRNKVTKLRRERDALLKKPQSPDTTSKLERCLNKLYEAEYKLDNRA